MRSRRLWILAAALCLVAGCGKSANAPERLRFSYNISSDDVEASKRRMTLLQAYLEKALGMKVDMVTGTLYSSTVEAMRAKRIDAATMGPMAYLLASQTAGGEAIAIPGTKSGGPGTYESAIFVRGDSPVKSMEDLVQNAEKYTFSFVDPSSTSGHVIPRAYLEGLGFDAEKRFRKVHFSHDHLTAAYTVLGKKVDAGALMPGVVRIMETKGKIKPGELRALWTSSQIPQSPLVVRKDLPVEIKDRLRAAFLAIGDSDPVLAKEMQVTTQHADFRYFPASDATYDELRKLARNQKTMRVIE